MKLCCGSGSVYLGKPDLDPYQSEKPNPNLHHSLNLDTMEAQNEVVEGRRRSQWRHGGSKWSRDGPVCRWSQIRITLMRCRIRNRIRIKVKRQICICNTVTEGPTTINLVLACPCIIFIAQRFTSEPQKHFY
jgi:hypothetical protein